MVFTEREKILIRSSLKHFRGYLEYIRDINKDKVNRLESDFEKAFNNIDNLIDRFNTEKYVETVEN